jgi:putative aminopeptidase FrvX
VGELGVGLLAPVTLEKRPHRYGRDLLAAPVAGRRAACAALLVAARQAAAKQGTIPRSRSLVLAFAVEQELSGRGIGTLAHASGPFEETLVVDAAGEDLSQLGAQWPRLGRVLSKPLAVRYPGTPVETVSLSEAEALARELTRWTATTR